MSQPHSSEILFVADAGPVAGLGHLQRCFALADAFSERGWASTFVGQDPAIASRTAATQHRCEPLRAAPWTVAAAKEVARHAERLAARLLVVDPRGEPSEFCSALARGPVPVCLLDDNGGRNLAADFLVNGNAHAGTIGYPGLPAARCLLGPAHVLLSSPYWTPITDQRRISPRELLVTLGGGDPHNLWPRLLPALARVRGTLAATVVIGPLVPRTAELAAALRDFSANGVVCEAPPSLHELIARADIVLTAAGQTLYELAALGRPAVAVQLAGNQGPQLRALAAAGTLVLAGDVAQPQSETTAVAAVMELARQPERLRQMSAAGQRLIDGQGARRVAAGMTDWLSRDFPQPGLLAPDRAHDSLRPTP